MNIKKFKSFGLFIGIFFGLVLSIILFLIFSAKEIIKVSVIIPVYNTEKYLDECLNNMDSQTLKEMEIICVNDGSTDNSLEVLKKHQKKDKRIKIINQENAGVSAARNAGIKAAKGKYIVFADSDDLIPAYAYKKAFECAEKYNADIVQLGNICFEDGEKMDLNSFSYDDSKIEVYTREKSENPYDMLKVEMTSIWNKIWKKSWLIENNLFFKEGIKIAEDGLFNIIAFANLDRLVHNNNIFYCYRQNRPESVLSRSNAKKNLENGILSAPELINNRYRFNFDNSDEWVVNSILDFSFVRITEHLTDEKDKIYFAKEYSQIIEDQLVKGCGVSLNSEQQKKIDILKKIAEKRS
ncbi:MAG: glycosyltransferase [Clostridia bacterium]|nr:glycosyltransferase [Clostridia bacterium]